MKKKAVFHWSGGKDSALGLFKILQENRFEVVSLLTTFDAENQSSNVHDIPINIIEAQAKSIGIPLCKVFVNNDLSDYKIKMQAISQQFKRQGIAHYIFADLEVSQMKTYRENLFNPMGFDVVEALENMNSHEVIQEFLNSGIKAKIVVIQEDKLSKSYLTKELNPSCVDSFPPEIDVCGEFGEYHSLAYAGGLFKHEVEFNFGEKYRTSHQIKLETGELKTYHYWQVEILD